MLALIFIYLIGRSYYRLAQDRNMHKWLYACIGVAVFYLGTIVGAAVIIAYLEFFGDGMDSIGDSQLNLLSIPFGILMVWSLYKILDKKWVKKHYNITDELNKIGSEEIEGNNTL